jgi:hypothetical protein
MSDLLRKRLQQQRDKGEADLNALAAEGERRAKNGTLDDPSFKARMDDKMHLYAQVAESLQKFEELQDELAKLRKLEPVPRTPPPPQPLTKEEKQLALAGRLWRAVQTYCARTGASSEVAMRLCSEWSRPTTQEVR